MKRKSRLPLYFFTLLAVVAVTSVYVERRGLFDRYDKHLDREDQLDHRKAYADRLRDSLHASQAHVEALDKDPLEIEASIRRVKPLVRPGEKVYRIKVLPDTAAGDAADNLDRESIPESRD